MDWYSWLGKTGLAPAVTHEYGRLFSDNELEPGDAPHFDHDLLKSMGITVAKHRLEILKLAKKDAISSASSSSCARRLARRASRCLARCARRLGDRGSSSVTVVPRICNGGGDDVVRVGAVHQRRGADGVKKMVLMITDGGGGRFSSSSHKTNLMFHECYEEEEEDGEDNEEGEPCVGEIKWDSMFQDLKPTLSRLEKKRDAGGAGAGAASVAPAGLFATKYLLVQMQPMSLRLIDGAAAVGRTRAGCRSGKFNLTSVS